MSIESDLCRMLDIRFVDSRMLVVDARANLDILGYPVPDQHEAIRLESLRLFEQRDIHERKAMRYAHWELEACKLPVNSTSLSGWHDSSRKPSDFSVCSVKSDSTCSNASLSSTAQRGILKNKGSSVSTFQR